MAILKNEQNISHESLTIFPALREISFQSKIFHDYDSCVLSCKKFVTDVAREINGPADPPLFKVSAEVNEHISGIATRSTDWAETEVARFWIYDQVMEASSATIAAVCRVNIFAMRPEHNLYH